MFTEQQRSQIDDIFLVAIEMEPSARAGFLDERCSGMNQAIRQEVEQLLAADQRADQANLSAAQLNVAEFVATTSAAAVEPTESTVGPYRLLEKLGEGGMGVVYMAEQKVPIRRRVAVKLVKPGMDTKQVVARFEAERQALAMMEHPNIARVLDVGTTELGRPYFVMELVKGVPITEYCDQRQLNIDQRLTLFIAVCQAVQHAHQKGVIHRDLKPSNILVAEYDNDPVPKVIDFGLAKAMQQSLTEKTMFTRFDQIVGTYEYMSPEQAKFNQLDIDTRTDVYSLGVLLYVLLTGSTPLDPKTLRSAALDELLRVIREVEPPRPSTKLTKQDSSATVAANRSVAATQLNSMLRGDLDSIVMKALEKERNRRYETSSALADDIRRFLDAQPVEATPPSTVYYASRFIRRHRSAVATATVALFALIGGVVVTTGLWLRSEGLASTLSVKEGELETQVSQLQEATEQLQDSAYFRAMNFASQSLSQSNLPSVYQALESQIPPNANARDLRGLEWYVLSSICEQNQGLALTDDDNWCLSPDLKTVAAQSSETVYALDPLSGQKLKLVEQLDASSMGNAANIVAISNDRTRIVFRIPDGLRIDHLKTGKSSYVTGHDGGGNVALSPDGKLGANMTSEGMVQVWELQTGTIAWSQPANPSNDEVQLQFIKFTEGSEQLITVFKRTKLGVVVWNVSEGTVKRIEVGEALRPEDACILSHNRILLGGDGGLQVIDVPGDDAQSDSVWLPNIKQVFCVAIAPKKGLLALGTRGNSVQVWDLIQNNKVWQHTLTHRTMSIEFVGDGNGLLVGTTNGAELHRVDGNRSSTSLTTESRFHWPDALDTCGSMAVLPAPNNSVLVWNPLTEQERTMPVPSDAASHEREVLALAIDPMGKCVTVSSMSKVGGVDASSLVTMDLNSGKLVRSFSMEAKDFVVSLDYFNDGKRIVVGSRSGVTIRNTKTGQTEWEFESARSSINDVSLSPDNAMLAAGDWDKTVSVWDVRGEPRLITSLKHGDAISCVTWSPDDHWLAVGDASGTITVYDATQLTKAVTLAGHTDPLQTLTFSPDGKTLFSGGYDGRVKLWRVATWTESAELSYDKRIHAVRCIPTTDKNRIGILVGRRDMHNDPAEVIVHWVDVGQSTGGP